MDRPGRSCHGHRVRPVFVLDAARTPLGARGGTLSTCHPADLVAALLETLAARTGADPGLVDDVILGCAMPVGSQGFNVARSAVLAAGWPDHVPAGTMDRQGVSSLAAIGAAWAAVAAGAADLVVAGGVEVMSTTPPGATLVPGAQPFGPAMVHRYRDRGGLTPPGAAAEALGAALGVSREDLDAYALGSHLKAAASSDAALVPAGGGGRDELPRPDLTLAQLAESRGAFRHGGAVTAANSAPMADGAAAVLVASEAMVNRLGLAPLARSASFAQVGADPIDMLTAGGPATERALARAGVGPADIDRFEVGEPFAAAALAWQRGTGADASRVNVGGGGIALGEPTGAVGARLLATLAHGLGGRWGVAVTVSPGGLGAAVVIERS